MRSSVFLAALTLVATPGALAQAPDEVENLALTGQTTLSWDAAAGADDYNVYRGLGSHLRAGSPLACHGDEVAGTSFGSPGLPPTGEVYLYLVTAESDANGEGTPGDDSASVERPLLGSCDTVMRNHVLDRTGYGWGEWSRDRMVVLGLQGYIQEQLDPESIFEGNNYTLINRMNAVDPPDTLADLQAISMVQALYARRQLQNQAALFWSNHFTTEYRKTIDFFDNQYADRDRQVLETVSVHHDELETFRDLSFGGNFRAIVEASALSAPMVFFLDTDANISSRPNENYARELLELHTMGVDCGYTQTDIEELARVMTGWNVCKKYASQVNDPLGICVPGFLIDQVNEPDGTWRSNFRTAQHDSGQKVLFAGTPYEYIIPDTSANPDDGVSDVTLAIDAIVAHPCTPDFIVTKLLQRFVTENPDQTMIDSVVAEWNDAGNPNGVGDLKAVMEAVFSVGAILDPDSVGTKIKTPFEQIASAYRALRPNANGYTLVRDYTRRMQHRFHENSIPTGYSELGDDWLDTNNLLERQNFGMHMSGRSDSNAGNNVINLLTSNGVTTAPGNAEAIVDFLVDVMFGGAITPAERQAAIDYLNTDDNGVPASYNNARIRETAGFLLGLAQFLEQ